MPNRPPSSPVRPAVFVEDAERAPAGLRAIVEACPSGLVAVGEDGRIRVANAHVERLFGVSARALEGELFERLVPEALSSRSRWRSTAGPYPVPRVPTRLAARRVDGTEIPVEIGVGSIGSEQGEILLVAITDVGLLASTEREVLRLTTDLRGRLEELGEALRAKDVLLREVHHRVKNNLQIVSSLLSLQARRVGDVEARRLFEESRDRLLSMSLVHEQLYASGDFGHVDFAAYLRTLIGRIARSQLEREGAIEVTVRSAPVTLGIDAAIPAGLMVHELVSNAVKHGYPNGGPGRIVVSLEPRGEGSYEMVVSDDGVGLGERGAESESSSFGRKMIGLLAQQLDADVSVTGDRGTTVTIRFCDVGAASAEAP